MLEYLPIQCREEDAKMAVIAKQYDRAFVTVTLVVVLLTAHCAGFSTNDDMSRDTQLVKTSLALGLSPVFICPVGVFTYIIRFTRFTS